MGGATITQGIGWLRGRRGESREDRKEARSALHEEFRLLREEVGDLRKRVVEAENRADTLRAQLDAKDAEFRAERSTARTYRMERDLLQGQLEDAERERTELLDRLDGEVGRLRRELDAHQAAHAYCVAHCTHVPECELRPGG